ncbi:hypothetical protein SRHO_G00033830 [Serrasalmus rhombeus]
MPASPESVPSDRTPTSPTTRLWIQPASMTMSTYQRVPVFAKTLKDVTLTRNVTTLQRKAGQNPNTQPSRHTPSPADGATPQALHLRPQHHAPHLPEQPDRQMRHRNNPGLPPIAGTHTAPLPQGPAPPPQQLQSRPGALTYAQAVSRPANPYNSELRDVQQTLSQTCTSLMEHGLWDLNVRTGDQPDFISTQGDHFITGDSINFPLLLPQRKLQHGKNLLQLCGSLGLYIVNGRLRGDSFGQLTYSSALGSSMVDYAITDLDQTFLRAFTVKPLTPLSDHSQTTVYLKRTAANDNRQKPRQMYKLRPPLRWAQDSIENISTPSTAKKSRHFLTPSCQTSTP